MEPTERVRVVAQQAHRGVEREDTLAVEEPLEIRIRPEGPGRPSTFVITMRTPGNDEDLAAGLLFAEGVLERSSDLLALGRPTDPRMDRELRGNVLLATLSDEAHGRAAHLRRGTVMGSACGVCGKTSIENVIPSGEPPLCSRFVVSPDFLYALPEKLQERQSIFSKTGGLHAAALFAADGSLVMVAEDIGRHNATDKLIGALLRGDRLPFGESVLLVSGRAGFEIVQKAYRGGVPILASVSAPSSLAVELAETAGVTLVGFLREQRFNVYTGQERIASRS